MAADSIDLEEELDRLYALPAGEFVAERNELAKRLGAAGDREAAGRVKKLPRPSLTAWAVNQLASRAGAELEGLRAAGERVRAAHLAGPKEQQAAAKARRDAISTLRVMAEAVLQEAGTSPARSHRQRITQTLEALSSQEVDGDQPAAGRLSQDLEPAGFDALSGLAAALAAAQEERPKPPPRPGPEPVARKRAAPQAPKRAQAAAAKVVALAAAKKRAEREAAAIDRQREIQRRELDRRRQKAEERLAEIELKTADLSRDAERTASELDRAKQVEAELVTSARDAERAAREARARAGEAAAATAQARRDADATAGARRRAEAEMAKAKTELADVEAAGRKLKD